MGALERSKKISDGTPINITYLFKTIAESKLKICLFPKRKPKMPIEKIGNTPFRKWLIIYEEPIFIFETVGTLCQLFNPSTVPLRNLPFYFLCNKQ